MLFGKSMWATKRTSGLSMPMPNAIVATTMTPSSTRKRRWCSVRVSAERPAWYGSASKPCVSEPAGNRLGALARHAVDDACVAAVIGEECQQLAFRVDLAAHDIADIGAIKTRDELRRVLERQSFDNILAGRFRCRRRQRHAGHAGKRLRKLTERQVVFAKIMAPLRDAMCLVDRNQGHAAGLQLVERSFLYQPFGRDVQELQTAIHEGVRAPIAVRRASGSS